MFLFAVYIFNGVRNYTFNIFICLYSCLRASKQLNWRSFDEFAMFTIEWFTLSLFIFYLFSVVFMYTLGNSTHNGSSVCVRVPVIPLQLHGHFWTAYLGSCTATFTKLHTLAVQWRVYIELNAWTEMHGMKSIQWNA